MTGVACYEKNTLRYTLTLQMPFVPKMTQMVNSSHCANCVSLKSHPTIELYDLFERLQKAGIYPTGGADLGDLQQAILFRRPEDSDQAIALLKRMGIDATCG